MLPDQNKLYKNLAYFLGAILAFLFFSPVFAQSSPSPVTPLSAQDMLVNFAKQVPQLMSMVTAIAYVLGMYFIFHGVMLLKQYGEARSMMSGERHLKGPLIYIVVGTLLLYLPTTVNVGMSTFWTDPNPYAYDTQVKDQWLEFINVIYLIIQFIGTIAFIRGLVILSHLAGHGQPGTFSRGLTHIIGGILCINIYGTVQVVMITLGIQT